MDGDDMTPPDNSFAKRITVQIPTASGDAIEAWVYLPEGSRPHPAVVMAHGIGGIKAGGLAPFAERLREEGFAPIAVGYPQFGGSRRAPPQTPPFSPEPARIPARHPLGRQAPPHQP